MKTATFLKYIRRTLAVVFGGLLLLFFLDFTHIVPRSVRWLANIQLVPALLNGLIGIVGLWLLASLLFGRIYCSVICPLGILQDVILRVKKWFYRARKQKKKLRTKYERPHNIVRYSLLGVGAVGVVSGWTALILWLDPYSNFGRIAVAAFKPVVIGINNALSSLLTRFGNYSVYHYEILNLNAFLALFGIALLVLLVVLVWRKERIWCNTICPVGTFLGLLSRFSLFQVSIDANRCNHCKNCTSNCKSRCIDDTQFKVDASRCVACYNCLDKCKQNAIHYRPNGWCKVKYKTEPKPKEETLNTFQLSRRRFVQGSALTLATLPFLSYAAGKAKEPKYETRSRYPLPPGAAPDFHEKCTGCQLCVSQCPMQVLRPAFMEHGVLSMMQPLLYFHPHAYCNYGCTRCSSLCPNGAILPLDREEKRLRQIGEVHFVENECVVKKFDQDCGACAEHCPTLAVHMVPYHNGLTIPAIDPAICVGCGACESICPVRPKAIFVEGLPVQRSIDAALMDAPTGGGEVDLDSLYDNVFGDETAAVEGTEAAEAASSASALTDTLPAAESAPIDFGF